MEHTYSTKFVWHWEKVYEVHASRKSVIRCLWPLIRLLVVFFVLFIRAVVGVVSSVRLPFEKCSWSVFPSRMGFCLPIFISTHKCDCDNDILLFLSFFPFPFISLFARSFTLLLCLVWDLLMNVYLSIKNCFFLWLHLKCLFIQFSRNFVCTLKCIPFIFPFTIFRSYFFLFFTQKNFFFRLQAHLLPGIFIRFAFCVSQEKTRYFYIDI